MKNILLIMVTALYVVITIEIAYAGDPVSKKATQGTSRTKEITSDMFRGIMPRPAQLPTPEKVEAALNNFKSAHHWYTGARTKYLQAIENCERRSYSSSDQRSAGCRDTDTVAQCAEKLVRKCVRDARSSRVWPRSGSYDTERDFYDARNKLLSRSEELKQIIDDTKVAISNFPR